MKRRFKKRQLPDWIGSSYDTEATPDSEVRGDKSNNTPGYCDVRVSSSSQPPRCNETHTAANDSKSDTCRKDCTSSFESRQNDNGSKEAAATGEAEAASMELKASSSQSSIGKQSCVKETCGVDGPEEDSDKLCTNQVSQSSTEERSGRTRCDISTEPKKRKKKRQLLGPMKPKSEAVLSFEKAVSNTLPLLKFEGEVVYTYSATECSAICEKFLSSLTAESKVYVGFDLEWTVTFQAGSSEKVSLVQLCPSEDRCYLFHISAMHAVPETLWQVLSDPCVVKVGLNIEPDMWKLERDYDGFKAKPVIEKCVVELSRLANEKLKSSERWSLDDLSRHVLRQRLKKDDAVRYEAWHRFPLCDQQIAYATADALACIKIYHCLA